MHKKISRLVEPNLQPHFLCLILFVLATIPVQPWLAAVEAAVLVGMYLLHRRQNRRRRRSLMRYLDSLGGMDSASKNSLLNTPLPVVVFHAETGEIIWANDAFAELAGVQEDLMSLRMEQLAPGLDCRRLLSERRRGRRRRRQLAAGGWGGNVWSSHPGG